jgi:hypothetical protein
MVNLVKTHPRWYSEWYQSCVDIGDRYNYFMRKASRRKFLTIYSDSVALRANDLVRLQRVLSEF